MNFNYKIVFNVKNTYFHGKNALFVTSSMIPLVRLRLQIRQVGIYPYTLPLYK